MEFQIKLNSMEDAVKLVNALEYHDCRAVVWIDSLVIDARSLMGLWGCGIGREIRIVFHSAADEKIREKLCEFMVA